MNELNTINLKLIEQALQADPNVKEVSIQADQVCFLTHGVIDVEGIECDIDNWQGVQRSTIATIATLKGYIMWNECPGFENEGSVVLR